MLVPIGPDPYHAQVAPAADTSGTARPTEQKRLWRDSGAMQMTEPKRFLIAFGAVVMALVASPAVADPWARPGDLALRHDIQLLADAGIIKSPVTTWPIPWGTLAADLAENGDWPYFRDGNKANPHFQP